MRKIKQREIAKKKLYIPIFCILYALWCITHGLPDDWVLWAFVAIMLDFVINPIYKHVEVEYVEE